MSKNISPSPKGIVIQAIISLAEEGRITVLDDVRIFGDIPKSKTSESKLSEIINKLDKQGRFKTIPAKRAAVVERKIGEKIRKIKTPQPLRYFF